MPLGPQAGEIQAMLDDFGVPVTIGGVMARCVVRDSDEEIAASSASVLVGRAVMLRAAPGAFPAAAQGANAVVDYPAPGTSYKVVLVRRDNVNHTSIVVAKV